MADSGLKRTPAGDVETKRRVDRRAGEDRHRNRMVGHLASLPRDLHARRIASPSNPMRESGISDAASRVIRCIIEFGVESHVIQEDWPHCPCDSTHPMQD
jgi:hypothetical protein